MEEGSSSSHTAHEHGTDEATGVVVRRMGRERLLRYVMDIVRKQTTPLRDILRDHALQYLPVQSLLRFRSISASWNRRISGPFFAHTQSHAHRTLSGLFYETNPGQVSYLPFDPNAHAVPDPSLSFLVDIVCVAATSNGLVACRSLTCGKKEVRYYLCNPATTQWIALPPSNRGSHQQATALVFQPSALDFSPSYYLVCPLPDTCCLEVFSSRTGKWRIHNTEVAVKLWGGFQCGPAVAVGGVAYWQANKDSVVSYDPAADAFCHLGAAPVEKKLIWRLGEMDGRLCCVGVEAGKVEVHALEHGGSSWCKVGCFEVLGTPWPLAFEGRGRRVVIWLDGNVVAVEMGSGRLSVLADGVPHGCATGGVPYISSLTAAPGVCSGPECFSCSSHRYHSPMDLMGSLGNAPSYI